MCVAAIIQSGRWKLLLYFQHALGHRQVRNITVRIISMNENPYNICTCGPEDICEGCGLLGKLKCRYDFLEWLKFSGFFSLFLVPGLIGMFSGGYGIYLWGLAAFWVIFFCFWEIKILCSHCPYYAREGFFLRCIANNAMPKFWKYNPAPMNRSESIQLLIGFTLLIVPPPLFSFLGSQYFWGSLSILGAIIFFTFLSFNTCTTCVNFSCPLNRVDKETVEAYLNRNEVMKKAWEKAGKLPR